MSKKELSTIKNELTSDIEINSNGLTSVENDIKVNEIMKVLCLQLLMNYLIL